MLQVSILSKEDTVKLLELPEVIEAVENVYVKKAKNETNVYPMVFHEFEPGVADMDIKSGDLKDDIFGLKMVSWYGENPSKGHPALYGTIIVCDSATGAPMGFVDGTHITGMRTGACAAIGAKYLAKKNSDTLLMVGAGHISTFAIASVITILPNIKTIYLSDPIASDKEEEKITHLKHELVNDFNLDLSKVTFLPAGNLEDSCKKTDIIITATPSKEPVIQRNWIKEGTHLSCIGADMPGKQELDMEILKNGRIFTDDTPQCMNVGEIEKAIKENIISSDDIVSEIGEVICGANIGRLNDDEITVFDATGMALLDLATAKVALLKAKELNIGCTAQL